MDNRTSIYNELCEIVDYRFSSELFHLFGESRFVVFAWGLRRLSIKVIVWGWGLVRAIFFNRSISSKYLGLYMTENQKIALEKLEGRLDYKLQIVSIYSFSASVSFRLFILSVLGVFLYICGYVFAKQYYSYHERLFIKARCSILVAAITNHNLKALFVSNDHQGEVFWLGFLLSQTDILVGYVQHGKVKSSFPHNYFDECYVRDQLTKNIYEKLCRNKGVRIYIISDSSSIAKEEIDQNGQYVLVTLSRQFYYFQTAKFLRSLRRQLNNSIDIKIRFHPSDRLRTLKFKALKLLAKTILLDDERLPFLVSFEGCLVLYSAASSVLAEAYEKDPERVIWVKSIGLKWDYYNLADHITVFEGASCLE